MAAYRVIWGSSQAPKKQKNMSRTALLLILGLSACTGEANHLGNPLTWPFQAAANGIQNASYAQTRGAVELYVKTHHPELVRDLRAGGGPALTEAFDIANVPHEVRASHTLQMQSNLDLYETDLGALVVAIMVVSG